MIDKPKESDWKQFKKLLPQVREKYLEKKNRELRYELTEPDKSPTEKFWKTTDKMEETKKILYDCFDEGYSRLKMFSSLVSMYTYKIIGDEEIKTFSETLQEQFKSFTESIKKYRKE
jgi:hypothetical protein